jgi:DNA-binding Lrp family transcriptional regulator
MADLPKLTETDHQLLGLLQQDARRTNRELAAAVGIAESTCLERIRGLRARGVITGYRAEVDLAALGRPIHALVQVRLQPKTSDSVRSFRDGLLDLPETLAVSMVTGMDDFVVEIAVPDVIRLRDFVLNHVTSRSDVADARTSIVYEQRRALVIRTAEA